MLSNFDLISDIHLERQQLLFSRNATAKYLVIAGDVLDFGTVINRPFRLANHERKTLVDTLRAFIQMVSAQYKTVFWVLGNHEYWQTDLHSAANDIKQWLKSNKIHNVCVLDNEAYETDVVTVLGTTLWTDARRNDAQVKTSILLGMNDYKYVRNEHNLSGYMSVDDTIERHSIAVQWLTDELQKCSPEKPALIVTHHHPVVNITNQYDPSTVLLHAYGSDLSNLICSYDDRIVGWCCGHVHDQIVTKPYMTDVPVICHPRGYYGLETIAYSYGPLNLGSI